MRNPACIWTVGHSSRSRADFLALLREHDIEILVDVRRWPTSRWPHFRQEALAETLGERGIGYHHAEALGGYRGDYVAYTETETFAEGLDELLALARGGRTAIMCAEALFFRCHRRFVADALVRRGVEVVHILGPGREQRHVRRPRVDEGPGRPESEG